MIKKISFLVLAITVVWVLSCKDNFQKTIAQNQTEVSNLIEYDFNPDGKTILERYPPTTNFNIQKTENNSFASYLQHLTLKPHGTLALYFNNKEKPSKGVYTSVVDMDISDRDLQQCADAIMRLKAEFHYQNKAYNKIHFNFLSDGKPRYYTDYAKNDYSYNKFLKYLDYVMAFANTASLKAELKPIPLKDIQIGDVFIKEGKPYGHAVIVVNIATDKDGNTQFMLAQSYMPAQQTQILINPAKVGENPWYDAKIGNIITPEWEFKSADLHRFP